MQHHAAIMDPTDNTILWVSPMASKNGSAANRNSIVYLDKFCRRPYLQNQPMKTCVLVKEMGHVYTESNFKTESGESVKFSAKMIK